MNRIKSPVLALADACPPLLGAACGHRGLILLYAIVRKKSSIAAILAEKNFIRVPLKFDLPLQVRGPNIPIRGPESFALIVAGSVCRHITGPVPAYIIDGLTFMLVDTAPADLHKRVVFAQRSGYYQTFFLGTVLVFNR